MKLTKLLNGTWIDLKTVTRVVPIPKSEGTGTSYPDRVVVHYGDNASVIDADTYEHAVKIAEDIAMRVNKAFTTALTIPEVTWSGNTKPLSAAIAQTTGNSAPFNVSEIETLLAADYVRNTLDMTDKPDTQE